MQEHAAAPISPSGWLERFRGADGARAKPYLDGIRAVAVLMIFVRHAWGHAGGLKLDLGLIDLTPGVAMFSTGVDLFFVLSGFLLARAYVAADFAGRPRPDIRRYYTQRILRIGPPYWVALALVLLAFTPWLIPAEEVYSPSGAIRVLVHALFGQAVYLPTFGSWHVETPFWTLTVEMIFYLLLPALVVLFLRRRWLVSLPISLAISLAWLYAVRYRWPGLVELLRVRTIQGDFDVPFTRFFLSHTFPSYLFHFAVGLTVCNLVVRRERGVRLSPLFERLTSESMGAVWFVLGLGWSVYWLRANGSDALYGLYFEPRNYMRSESAATIRYYFCEGIPFAIGYGLILFGASVGPGWLRRPLSLPSLCFIGVIGYSVYLLHMPLLYLFQRMRFVTERAPYVHLAILWAAAGLVTLAVSTLFFVLVERPAMNAAKRLSAKEPAGDGG